MSLWPIGFIVFGFMALFFSRPLFLKSSFDWWSQKFWGKPADSFTYTFNRYYRGAESLGLAIMSISLGIGLLLKASDLMLSGLFLTEGAIIFCVGLAMYFNKSLAVKFINLTWSPSNYTDEGKYAAFMFVSIGLLLLFTAYVFRPLNFYF